MHRPQFYTIINRILSGTATINDREKLEKILAADQELKQLYGVLFSDTIEEKDHSEAMQAYAAHFAKMQLAGHFDDTESSYPDEMKTIHKGKSIRMKYYVVLVAAVLIVASAWFFYNGRPDNQVVVFNNEVVTKKGSQTHVKLPDGTKVWLNSDSKLLYPDKFDAAKREVQLIGEGYFEVTSNKERPFIIHAGPTNVKVLGTAFNLRAYPDEKEIETTLIHGVVEVTLKQQPGNVIQMNAGEKLSVRNTAENRTNGAVVETSSTDEKKPVLLLSKTQVVSVDSVALETVWRENRLAFDADNFGKMISKISKWYNVEIVVNDPTLYTANFTAVFEDKTMEQVLDALQYTGKFTYRIQGNTVYIN